MLVPRGIVLPMTRESLEVDVLVIGWGKAGKTLAGLLAGKGRRVALVEKSSEMYGGSCINIACIPTKDLIVSAENRRESDDPATYFASSVDARDTLINKLRSVNHGMLEGKVTLLDGFASFTSAHTVSIAAGAETLEVTAETIIINVGTIPNVPDIPGADLPGVFDSTTIQHVSPFPARLGIIGGSFIAMEFASMFRNFGSEVTMLDRSETFGKRLDADVAAVVRSDLEGAGVKIVSGARVASISSSEGGVRISLEDGSSFDYDAALLATGRTPATAGLNLEAAGIETNERGFIRVDDHLLTNVPGIYAVGDVNGGPQFTYVSYDDHRIVADHLLGSGTRAVSDRVAVPTTTFLTPPLATVGMTESEARESGRSVLVASAPVASIAVMPRPKIVGDPRGIVKFLVDAESEQILGANLYCIDSQELINTVALAMRMRASYKMLLDGIWTHPSSTEAFNGVLGSLKPVD